MRLLLRTTSIIVILILLDLTFYACRQPKDYKYKYTEAQFFLSEYNLADNTRRFLNTDDNTAKLDFFYIDVELKSEVLALNVAVPQLLFNSAYAFTFYDRYTNTSRLKRIKIKTLEDFNDDFKAGSNLHDSLTFGLGYSANRSDSFTGAATLVQAFNNYPEYISNMDKMAYHGVFWLKLTEKPTINTPQQLALEVELEDGSSFAIQLSDL